MSPLPLLTFGCVGFSNALKKIGFTALPALQIATRRLRPEVRANLLHVVSDRTGQDFRPKAWRFVFRDKTTSSGCRVVTVAENASSEHPDIVEAFESMDLRNISKNEIIPQNQLTVDSDAALKIASTSSESCLNFADSAEYQLVKSAPRRKPFWKIYFYSTNKVLTFLEIEDEEKN